LLHVTFPWQLDVGALSRNNGIVQHCCVSLATQQLKRRAYQQAAWLRTQQYTHVTMVFGILLTSPVCFGIRSRADVRVFGYGVFLVGRLSSYRETVRGAREFIPWTVKTFDRRGW
jgi:hypothetical protein